MAVGIQRLTLEEFERVTELPDNAGRLFEFVGGEVIEVVSNQRSSALAARILIAVGTFVQSKNLGFVTGADGGYALAGERYIPDVAFVSKTRQTQFSERPYSPIPPDLAVQVLSPSNSPDEMRIKVVSYLNAGTTVWIVNPDRQRVEVYIPGQSPYTLGPGDTLSGGDVLPGFTMAVDAIFVE
jgi:Uma2 family endonuclease